MTEKYDDDGLHGLWRTQDAPLAPISLDEIKQRAGRFSDRITKRNRLEYLAIALVVTVFGFYAIILPELLLKIGSLLTIAGVLIAGWQLSRRTSRPDPAAESADFRTYYRARLVREEHMLAHVGRWYLGPMLPGLAVFAAGSVVAAGASDPFALIFGVGIPALVFAGVWWLNRRAAVTLRRQIAQLDQSF